jgi:hypothetical protein
VVKKRLWEAYNNGKPQAWESMLAKAHMVYAHMENRGVSDGLDVVHPIYSTETFSGRSKTTGFALQGQGEESTIRSVVDGHSLFVHCDWSAADARVASLMSGDKEMEMAFQHGDPYATIVKKFRSHGIIEDREQVKKEWLRVVYSMDVESAVLSYFPTMRKWMVQQSEHLKKHGWLESIMGRRFKVEDHAEGGERGERAVFNAILQGSVAHAMHATLANLADRYPDNIFAEIHDSVVLTCSPAEVEKVVNGVEEIMSYPFKGILESNPKFPVKISLGNEWKKWLKVKR